MSDAPKRPGPGRPSKLEDPDTRRKLLDETRLGRWMVTACSRAKVSRGQVYEWLQRGEAAQPAEGDDLYVEFAAEFREAEAEFETWALDQIDRREKGWQALAWHLERRWPDRYGARAHVAHEHSGPGGGPLKFEIDAAALSAKITALAALSARAALGSGRGDADAGDRVGVGAGAASTGDGGRAS